MTLILQAVLLLGLIGITIAIIFGKDLMISVVIYCAFSFLTMLLYNIIFQLFSSS